MAKVKRDQKLKEYKELLIKLRHTQEEKPAYSIEVKQIEEKLEKLQEVLQTNLSAWDRVMISRDPARPHTIDYIQNLCTDFEELCGDRSFTNDEAVIGGLGKIDGHKFMVIGQEKGNTTEERIKRNFGMMQPEGYRKALRLMQFAEKFKLPILTLIDTPGAFPGLEAEERGQGSAIAYNLREMFRLQTPILSLIIGEGCSGGALGIGIADAIGMLEHSYYSVISPEGCASILWKDAKKRAASAEILKLNAEHMLEYGVIDEILLEPIGGAHNDPQTVYDNTKEFVLRKWDALQMLPPHILTEERYRRFRKLGAFTTAPPTPLNDEALI